MPEDALIDPKFSTWENLLWFRELEHHLRHARHDPGSNADTVHQLLSRRRAAILEVMPQLLPIWKHEAVLQQLRAFDPRGDAVNGALKHLASLPAEALVEDLAFPITQQDPRQHSAPCVALACLTYILYRLTISTGVGQATPKAVHPVVPRRTGSKSLPQAPVPARQAVHTQAAAAGQPAQAVWSPKPMPNMVPPQPSAKRGTGPTSSGPLRLLSVLQRQQPWTPEWHTTIASLEAQLLKTDDSTFEEVLASRMFSEVLNLLEFIERSPTGADTGWGWLLRMAWDFAGYTQAAHTFSDATYNWLFSMRKHYELALVAWDIARRPHSQMISLSTRRSCAQNNTYRRWINEAQTDGNTAGQRKAQIRVRMARHVVQCLQDVSRLRPVASPLPQSVFELGSHGRRFGGGRPRSERFRR